MIFDVEFTVISRYLYEIHRTNRGLFLTLNRRRFDVQKYLFTWWLFVNVESTFTLRRIFYGDVVDVDDVYSTYIPRCRSGRYATAWCVKVFLC